MNDIERVPFVDLSILHREMRSEIIARWTSVLDGGWFIQGAELLAFEAEFAEFTKTKFCAGVGNGLDAITIALQAMNVGAGDRVVVPAHTFVATALAVVRSGAEVVLADVDSMTGNMTATNLEAADTNGVRGVMPVHLYGQICLMDKISALAKARGWFVLEDNAQSQGAELNGRPAGAWGDIAATSFYPGKNIGAFGDAGAVLTADSELDRKVRMIRNYGSERKYHHEVLGCNSRLDEIQAAVLRIKLRSLCDVNKLRIAAAERYLTGLKDVSEIHLPIQTEGVGHVYHLFVIRTPEREKLQAHLSGVGIESAVHYPFPIHKQKAFSDLRVRSGQFPNSELWAKEALSLPLFPGITEHQQRRVMNAIRVFYGRPRIEE